MPQRILMAFLVALILISGCAPSATQKKTTAQTSISEGEAIVFGKIVFIENGEPRVPYSVWSRSPLPFFYKVENEKTVKPKWRGWGNMVKSDGSFFVRLPKGTYVVYRIEYGYVVIPQVAFQIPPGADAYYLGTLEIDLDVKRGFWGPRITEVNSIEVTDEFELAVQGLKDEYPGIKGEVKKNLMAYEGALPPYSELQDRHALMEVLGTLGFGILIIGQ